MADEGCDLAVGAAKGNALVDAPGEVGDAVFKVVVCDLHDICVEVCILVDHLFP